MNPIELRLKECLQKPYESASCFLKDIIFPVFGEDNFEDAGNLNLLRKMPELQPKADASGITSIIKIGDLYVEGSELGLYDVTLDYKKHLQRNRVEIQQIIRSLISTHSGAFIIFHYQSGARWEWRFTFCHKGASNVDSTDAKRYTFLLGPGQSCRTAAENFLKLHEKIEREGEFEMNDIIRAFDVEALSKEFFTKYKIQYERFCRYIYENRDNRDYFGEEFSDWEDKTIRDYVKKLLGRIVFLHFLQKKGWLGVPVEKEWGEGDSSFMRNLFLACPQEAKDNYLDAVLEPLFDDLNTKRDGDLASEWSSLYTEDNSPFKVPYLNGGLFERDSLDEPESKFPAEFFADLLEFFYQYNFTIDENDPDDAEVGIDPEMLGRIFENLLEDNKDKGAFYTPKEIVQYMCKESLIAYLQTGCSTDRARDAARHFVTTHDISKIKELHMVNGDGEKIDGSVLEFYDNMLKDVKICDPAIGSGAFPMGLLKELFACRLAIEGDDTGKTAAEIKRDIIQNSIYGVDIEKGAVEIARLRFWLSLIIDEQTPHALPNMDFKIMQGNSLLEQYEGIDLSGLSLNEQAKVKTQKGQGYMHSLGFFGDDILEEIQESIHHYYLVDDHNKKVSLRSSINNQVIKYIRTLSGYTLEIEKKLQALSIPNDQFFLWHIYFKEVFDRGGFDIVIGNPPYIQLQKDGGYLADLYKPNGFQTFDRMGDIYCLFYEQGYNLLKEEGTLCYITSNKWMRTGYGEKTRAFVKDRTNPKLLIDFIKMKLFDDATVETNILLLSKEQYKNATKCAALVELKKADLSNLNNLITSNLYENKFDTNDFWTLSDATTGNLKNKIKRAGTPLRDWDLNIFRGVLTGFNDAFIISTEKKKEILSACISEDERDRTEAIMHPIIRGKDVGVYLNNWAGLWIINVHNGLKNRDSSKKLSRIDIKDYPTLKKHLDNFWDKLQKRADKGDTFYNLRNCAYLLDFDKPKIIWKRIGSILRFSYDEDKSMCLDSTCFATGEHVKFLVAIFNSKLGHFMLQDSPKTGTGDLLISVQAIEPIVVPTPTYQQKKEIENLVDGIICAMKSGLYNDIPSIEASIDYLVYELYGLTPEEIAIVERSN